ncbi:MAG: YihY/virulence factor BrkB family protein [Psychrilyobacter sp.]|nr:YihY/virulence factor BrkB family protein [Psychrilyobacter sp.]
MEFHFQKFIKKIRLQISQSNKIVFKILKLILFTFENYKKSRSELWSSALTFYSLLTIVPVIAIAFVITQGFGIEKALEEGLAKNFFLQGKVLDQILKFSHNTLNHTKNGLIAGTGILFLSWSVIKIFSVVEKSFNEIWKVEESRTFIRKLTDYMSIIFLFPIVLIMSNGLTTILQVFIKTNNPSWVYLLNSIPQLLTVIFFTLIYLIVPNTKVKLSSAIFAGVFSGILFHITQFIFVYIQLKLLNYNAIYGSFSLIPIYIMWQKIMWLIILLGAHLSFIIQNSYKYAYTINEVKLSASSKRDISFLILYYLIKNYEENDESLSTGDIAYKLGISIGVTQDMLNVLKKLKFIVEIVNSTENRQYKLSRNVNEMTLGCVITDLSSLGYSEKFNDESKKILEQLEVKRSNHELDILIKDIIVEESKVTGKDTHIS